MERKTATTTNGSAFGWGSFGASVAVGAGVGLFGWLLTLPLENWLKAVFCRSADTAAVCTNIDAYAWGIAHVVLLLVSLFILVRANIFRPLLAVLAASVSLWMIGLWFVPLAWWIGAGWEALLFALAYAVFAWAASAESFILSLVIVALLTTAFRLLIAL